MPGVEEPFRWCHQNNIKVDTDTGFNRKITHVIMDGLRWKERNLIVLAVDIENTYRLGRLAPFMIFCAMEKLTIRNDILGVCLKF